MNSKEMYAHPSWIHYTNVVRECLEKEGKTWKDYDTIEELSKKYPELNDAYAQWEVIRALIST